MKRTNKTKEKLKKTMSDAIDVMDNIEILMYIKEVTLFIGKTLFHVMVH